MPKSSWLFLISLNLLVILNICAQETTTLPKNSKIRFYESEFTFPKGVVGKPITHEFAFINEGKIPLKIDSVKASCGCTTPQWTSEMIMSGGKGKITATYNMGHAGTFNKSITVSISDGQKIVLYIKGEAYDKENVKNPSQIAPSNNINSTKEIKKSILEPKKEKKGTP